jgi:A/G-specific adenine glycosylase
MLQQTQVKRVVEKYTEFLARFPTLEALATASAGDVIRAWAGLGYNRRAVRLHALAQRVVAEHHGRLPARAAELAKLDGLGVYTSSAVACFAFGQHLPVVDTNVRRVLGRIGADRLNTAQPAPRAIHELAYEVLPDARASEWSQGLMDLGATICTARAPACGRCPIEDLCALRSAALTRPTAGSIRAAEARVSYRHADTFTHSARYFRGKIIQRLRELQPGEHLSLASLGRALRDGFSDDDLPWLEALVQGLAADGLLRIAGDSASGATETTVGLP